MWPWPCKKTEGISHWPKPFLLLLKTRRKNSSEFRIRMKTWKINRIKDDF